MFLVVESSGYDDRTRVDPYGSIHSDQMHLEERSTRLDHDNLEFSLDAYGSEGVHRCLGWPKAEAEADEQFTTSPEGSLG